MNHFVTPSLGMQQEVELTESSEVTEKPTSTIVTTDDHSSSPASIKTLFLRYSIKKERVLLVLGFLCTVNSHLSF